ncbi:MAG: hypothetical protein K8S62_12370 [Candidatus Sabulitectum sp.]|nr:hypothetical protein [Candidatus Sabulitectum sp.]
MKNVLIPSLSLALVFLIQNPVLAVTDSGAEHSPYYGNSLAFSEEVDATGDDLLTTIFFQNNSFAGNSFDITASTDLTVVGFEVNLDPLLPSCTVNIWTREGTANGFEQIATGWTLLGTDVVVPVGINYPTHVDVGGLEISSGETVGVIITVEEAGGPDGGLMYTNGGPNTYSNSDMSIITYRGLSGGFPPTSVWEYRIWNGTVHYNYGTPTSRESWGCIKVGF